MKTTIEAVTAYVEEITPRLEDGGLPVSNWAWVGSTYINGEGNDVDILVLTLGADIHSKCWSDFNLVYGGSDPHGSDDSWASTKDAMGHNIIFITDPAYFEKWVAAANACRYIQDLLDSNHYLPLGKAERVKMHRIIMDGDDA